MRDAQTHSVGLLRRVSLVIRAERWLTATWPFVSTQLPTAPAAVLEIGCGSRGGFIPTLLSNGYEAIGVDPEAPATADYRRTEFEQYERAQPVDAVVACTSLHHVADLDNVLDRVAAVLAPGGTLVVVEWAWERFDQATGQWCFTRLARRSTADEPGWLHAHRAEWAASHHAWDVFQRQWARQEHLHTGEAILRALVTRFEQRNYARGPYFFADLDDTAETDEQAAIDTGEIQATCIRYTGIRR
ncbi:MAG: class I SAM-dependent methyltransferase [Sciscionella sp.]